MKQIAEDKKRLSGQRESNYDLLRIISAIAVITIHVSAIYKGAITDSSFFGQPYEEHMIYILIYSTLVRFAVPCFVMLSGAFLLADDRNSEYKYFYKKSMKSVGVPTIVFSILYFLYSEVLACVDIVVKGEGVSKVLTPVKSAVKGSPYYHMWYLYTLIGIYILVPVILQVKKSIGEKAFLKVSIVILLVASISGWTSTFELNWSIAKVICYIGYLLIGYQFRRCNIDKKNNKTGILLIVSGIMVECVLTYIQYVHSLKGLAEADEKYSLIGNFSPLVVIVSLLIFAGFSKLNINCCFDKLSSQTFNIYLIHAGVNSILSIAVRKIGVKGDARIIIPIGIVAVFIVSYLLSVIYTKLWRRIERRFSVSERICKVIKLE